MCGGKVLGREIAGGRVLHFTWGTECDWLRPTCFLSRGIPKLQTLSPRYGKLCDSNCGGGLLLQGRQGGYLGDEGLACQILHLVCGTRLHKEAILTKGRGHGKYRYEWGCFHPLREHWMDQICPASWHRLSLVNGRYPLDKTVSGSMGIP